VLDLNPHSRIDAFYMAGAGHFRRRDPITGESETMEDLENAVLRRIYGRPMYGGDLHSLSFLFLQQDGDHEFPHTFLPRRSIPAPMPDASSGVVRSALAGEHDLSALSMLPFRVFRRVQDAVNSMNGYENRYRAIENAI
jgi:hypothetical protein